MTARIVAVGSINVDAQMRSDRWPERGESMLVRDFHFVSGGKAGNVAVCARRLGCGACLVGCVGDDGLADRALAGPRSAGVEELVAHVPGPTGVAMLVVRPDGEKTSLFAPNANDGWRDREIDAALRLVASLPPTSALVVDFEISPSAAERVLEAGQARGLGTVLDPSPASRVTDAALATADVVTPNANEAATLTGISVSGEREARRAVDVLLERGARSALVKLPKGGCVVGTRDRSWLVRAPRGFDVVDETGAGDAFASAVAVALTEQKPLTDAAILGVAAATFAITRYGAQASYPNRTELDSLAGRLVAEPYDPA
jgi:ribokinase